MTPKGERTFAVQHGESKLSGMKEGMPITGQLNEAGRTKHARGDPYSKVPPHPLHLSHSSYGFEHAAYPLQSGVPHANSRFGITRKISETGLIQERRRGCLSFQPDLPNISHAME